MKGSKIQFDLTPVLAHKLLQDINLFTNRFTDTVAGQLGVRRTKFKERRLITS